MPRTLVLVTVWALAGALHAQEPASPRPPVPVRTSLGAEVAYSAFDDSTAAWKLGAITLSRRSVRGLVAARVNVAERFGETGVQYEVDGYPAFDERTYAYLNIGRSTAQIFPAWRFGGELFTVLPRAWEASAGVRQLDFTGESVTLYTGSVGKYTGNYWLSLRPWLRMRDGALSTSAGLTARRYYETADDHVGLRVSAGAVAGDRLTAVELARTSTIAGGIHASRGLASRLIGTGAVGYERETFADHRSRARWELTFGMRADF